jgi:hypothetical protein
MLGGQMLGAARGSNRGRRYQSRVKRRERRVLMSMQQGVLVFSRSMRAPPRPKPTLQLAEAPENRPKHGVSTRIGASYGKSRLRYIEETERIVR